PVLVCASTTHREAAMSGSGLLTELRARGLIWPTLLMLAGLAFLVSLGNWQMQRLHWKQGLVGSIAERVDAPAVSPQEVERRASEGGDIEYTRVTAQGRLLANRELH